MILDSFGVVEDETELPGDDISVDEVMEASFEHARDEWMGRNEDV